MASHNVSLPENITTLLREDEEKGFKVSTVVKQALEVHYAPRLKKLTKGQGQAQKNPVPGKPPGTGKRQRTTAKR